ncbi:hypothetical protein Sjap_016990 [Stephania japonica]|uniref:Uncharacterized protein n=1 Tax=Stephania japonica TaxID=461633 RepID=A0AAP0I5F5_9MAGN
MGLNNFSQFALLLILSLNLCHLCFCSLTTSDLFDHWCKQHGKSYSSEEERVYRLRVFEDNLEFVNQHNGLSNSTYKVGLNAFADLTHHEFRAAKLGLGVGGLSFGRLKSLGGGGGFAGDVPESIDWRKKGAVTPVKDQASCGACWAFSTTGAIEGINQIKTGSLVSLSEQELIDCDRSYNSGCGGGLMDYAFQFVIKNHGIDTESDYPYQAVDRSCNRNKLKRRVVTIDGYTDIPSGNEQEILKVVATQPVSVGLCGSERGFQLYSSGIFSGPCSTTLNHAVVIVGYASENGVDYWILKNSWGKKWGMDGYMHMRRNNGDSQGICGINMLASYPTKTSPNPPPSPSPSPTRCSLMSYCGAGQTCCCGWRLLGLVCLSWRCCALDSAVCCKDHVYCCPHDYPICDTQTKQCLRATGNYTLAKPFERKDSSSKLGGLSSVFEAWNM